ncbi:transcriptional regulator with XRE-family HTH domain [Thermocatellispora tengchongensis]|uniref:Transcriptional regulator with XRE-family HTH domain n=1 Tax=Thermocatellispora tengchongensis TaxID=1073253 RepID=A0A840P7X7_9ACTN|nr:helix-turn-helix transcriptional regulator [Thermocatellispora tengchongensis]MBB5133971.1 transcriptional regulator with XRE-family HTH domain [Thermocatellispora tengchongensis]
MDETTTNDAAGPVLSLGQRIQYLRERRGMTREVLAGLVGKSESWLKAVERGQRQQQPRLPILLQLAEALRVRDLSELTGDQSMPIRMFTGPGHPALAAVREAVNALPLQPTGTVQPLTTLRARLDSAWRTRHSSPDHRTALGRLLPDLIRDAQLAAVMYQGEDRRRAQALLAEVYGLTQMFVAYQPAQDLLWRVADRALMAAQESEDPLALSCAVWFLAQAHRDAADFDAARSINEQGLTALSPHMDRADTELLAMWGALHFELAFTAARLGEAGEAWRHWEEAGRIADRLPGDYYQPWTSFSRVIMRPHAVTVAVELHQSGESARQADHAEAVPIPSRPRRGRHLIEVARAHQLQHDHDAVLGTLELAQQTAPETIRYNGYARRMTLEMAEAGPARLRRQARELADKIGVLT